MAAYFQFTRKQSGEIVPPTKADDEMREALGYPADKESWLMAWFDIIGFRLALGHRSSFNELRADFPDLAPITNFIEQNYDVSNGYCR